MYIEEGNFALAIDSLKSNIKFSEANDLTRLTYTLINDLIVVLLQYNRLAEAKQYANSYNVSYEDSDLNRAIKSHTYRSRIYLLLWDKSYDLAEQIIVDRMKSQRLQKRYHILSEYYRLLAIIQEKKQLTEAAELSLIKSLTIAAPRHYVAIYSLDKATIHAILSRIAESQLPNSSRGFCKTLITSVFKEFLGTHLHAETLTKKEIKVIRLAESGDSTQQLADTLSLSQSTIKWHLHNIYSKLDVKNRTQAINKARELGYL